VSYDEVAELDRTGYIALAIPRDEFVSAMWWRDWLELRYQVEGGHALHMQGDADAVRTYWEHFKLSDPASGDSIVRATVPAAAAPAVPFVRSNAWNWMTTDVSPPLQPRESEVELLNDDALIDAFLNEANPDASTRPGDPEIVEWAVVRDQIDRRRLLASAAVTQWRSGGLVLVSVATRPDSRGQGLAAAVSAFLTRRVIESGRGPMSLGHYADNDVAERVYQRLGFETRGRNVSGWLIERKQSTHA
jgi:GNAT superfamily N-acetyltransferase